jgi:hypothetical protein
MIFLIFLDLKKLLRKGTAYNQDQFQTVLN